MKNILLNTLLVSLLISTQGELASAENNCSTECMDDLKKAGDYINNRKNKEALNITEKYCAENVALACYTAAKINTLITSGSEKKVIDQYKKACDGGIERGCYHARGYTSQKTAKYDIDELIVDDGSRLTLDKKYIKNLHVKNNSAVILKQKTYINQTYPSVRMVTVSDASAIGVDYGVINSIALYDKAKLIINSGVVGKILLEGNNAIKIHSLAEIGSILVTNGSNTLNLYDSKIKTIHLNAGDTSINLHSADISTLVIGSKAKLKIAARNSQLKEDDKAKYLHYTAANGTEKRALLRGSISNLLLL
jgi:hypothetical protein